MNGAASRSDRRAASQRRNRLLIAVGGGALVIAAVVVAVLALGGDGSDDNGQKASDTTSGPRTTVELQVGEVSTDSAGPTAAFSPEQAQQVLTTIRAYLDGAAVQPLRSGQPAGDLSAVFDPGTLARVTGVDRPIMLQEGLPKVTGDITVTARPVDFVGLGDQDGKLVLVTAAIQLTIDGKIAGSKALLHIEQQGDLVFA
ncbi:MAG: hypothetical protein WEB19_00715, partial [Acidimicrobiia bacterium]